MKSSIFAAASVAALVSAHEARSPLDLSLDVADLVSVDLCLGLDVKLPLGISLDTDGCPKHGPPSDCTNVWHPSHDVDIDGCDNNDESDWHYVHPCKGDCGHAGPPHRWTTSTITETSMSTVIGCPPDVHDCPSRSTVHTVVTIPATTTICPVLVTSTTLATVPAPAGPATVIQATVTQTPVAPYPAATQGQQPPATYVPAPPAQQPPVAKYPSGEQPPVAKYPAGEQPPVAKYPAGEQTPVAQPPASQYPPVVGVPSQQPPVAPYPTHAPSVVPAPAGYPVAPVPGPVGTGAPYNPGYSGYPANTTSPVVVGAASANSQKLGMAAAAIGLAAALLL